MRDNLKPRLLNGTGVASWRAMLLLPMLALNACTGFIPAAGPTTDAVMNGAASQNGSPGTDTKPALSYAMITLDPNNVNILNAQETENDFAPQLTAAPAEDVRIGVGDMVAATIFESQAGGLFIPANTTGNNTQNFVALPPQQINDDGYFSVPYGGNIRAVGLTPVQLQNEIVNSISNRAIQPQAIVSIVSRHSNQVSVTGDVNVSSQFSVDPGGDKLLDAIARAGGPRFPTYESSVTLQRNGQSYQTPLADVLQYPVQNVELQPGDNVIVSHEQRYFLAMGAVAQATTLTQLNQRFPFDQNNLTLADAIARAGGLTDSQANPAAVFLFRFERSAVLRQLGVQVADNAPARVPTVYRADLTNASTLFLADKFPMQDGDIIFVSDSSLTAYQKFFSVILPFAESGSNFRAFNP